MAGETIELQNSNTNSAANQEAPRTDASNSPVVEDGGPNGIRSRVSARCREGAEARTSKLVESPIQVTIMCDKGVAIHLRKLLLAGLLVRHHDDNGQSQDVPPGYSKLAAFIDLEEDLAVFRRFSRLHARLLLYRQADIEEIEEELEDLDRVEAENARISGNPASANNRSWRKEKDLEEYRLELIKRLRKSMKAYDDELLRYKTKLALKDAADWQIQNIENWMSYPPHPLVPSESRFLEDRNDICTLKTGGEDSAVLTDALRSWLRDSCGCLAWVFRKKGNPASYGDPSIVYYNTKVKDGLARLAYATLISAVLVAAVVALFFIQSDEGRLIGLCVATFLCGLVMALFTTAKKGEIMGATAAYCAVLVVFVGGTLGDMKDGKTMVPIVVGNITTTASATATASP